MVDAKPTLGSIIRERRESLGMTQSSLARAVDVMPGAVAHWEAGRRRPQRKSMQRIALALGLDVNVLRDAPIDPDGE